MQSSTQDARLDRRLYSKSAPQGKRLETEIALERADSASLSSAPSAAPTDTESDADADSPKARNQSRLRRSSRSQRPTGPPRGSPLADYVMQGLSQVCTWICCGSTDQRGKSSYSSCSTESSDSQVDRRFHQARFIALLMMQRTALPACKTFPKSAYCNLLHGDGLPGTPSILKSLAS